MSDIKTTKTTKTDKNDKTDEGKGWDLNSEFEFVLFIIVTLVVVGLFMKITGFSLADYVHKDTTTQPTITAYADAKASTTPAPSR